MKRLFFLILIAFSFTLAFAQTVSFDFRNTTLAEALTQLAAATSEYDIQCVTSELDSLPVSVRIRNLSIPDAVTRVTKGQPVMDADLDKIREADLSPIVITVLSN
jgi:hypothetical protein